MDALAPYRLPMQPIPERLEGALAAGVRPGDFPRSAAASLLAPGYVAVEDGVLRSANGMLIVCCRTDMPDVTADMIDWWFGWHLPQTERYQLWHPQAHIRSAVKEDRSALAGQRAAYVGNESFVDEYIGSTLQKLIIAFREPASMGLDPGRFASSGTGTAICARVSLRDRPVDTGWLLHQIRPTPYGSEMRSRFWLGDVCLRLPVIGRILTPLLNRPAVRRRAIPDQVGLDLLRHCAEEMNHLARFLPALYADMGVH
jgi:hypothetical protein